MAALASREETIRALAIILADPEHAHFIQALKFAADRGYGRPSQSVTLESEEPQVVVVAPPKLSKEEWIARYAPGAAIGTSRSPLLPAVPSGAMD